MMSLSDYNLIRIICESQGGFGHQRAAITLMQRLRELGFKGAFHFCYLEYPEGEKKTGRAAAKLQILIPEFKEGEVESPTLGIMHIERIYPETYFAGKDIDRAELCFSAACDTIPAAPDIMLARFNTEYFVQLQPTDWQYPSAFRYFITKKKEGITSLPKDARLTSSRPNLEVNGDNLTDKEKRLQQLVGEENYHSQLVYRFYNSKQTRNNRITPSTFLDRLVSAHLELAQNTNKPSILIFPTGPKYQDIIKDYVGSGNSDAIYYIDNITEELPEDAKVIIIRTDRLIRPLFDWLLLKGTSLPPVIEGCNARELCESTGRAFIHGMDEALRYYKMSDYQHDELQETHAAACRVLSDEDCQEPQALLEFLLDIQEFKSYCNARKEAFLQRPDAVEDALKTLGISYGAREMAWQSATESDSDDLGASASETEITDSKEITSVTAPLPNNNTARLTNKNDQSSSWFCCC